MRTGTAGVAAAPALSAIMGCGLACGAPEGQWGRPLLAVGVGVRRLVVVLVARILAGFRRAAGAAGLLVEMALRFRGVVSAQFTLAHQRLPFLLVVIQLHRNLRIACVIRRFLGGFSDRSHRPLRANMSSIPWLNSG